MEEFQSCSIPSNFNGMQFVAIQRPRLEVATREKNLTIYPANIAESV